MRTGPARIARLRIVVRVPVEVHLRHSPCADTIPSALGQSKVYHDETMEPVCIRPDCVLR